MKPSFVTVTDMFCGAGGSSTGAVQAGAEVQLAMNHWNRAIATHNANHPNALHVQADISQTDPRRFASTTILISSPECTNHSLSKSKQRKNLNQMHLWDKPIDASEERSRATMWDVPRWCEYHNYQIVVVENVVDVRLWVNYEAWLMAMTQQGYDHQEVYFNSMFALPTPQSRDRYYCVFWKRGQRPPDLNFRPLAYCPHCGQDVDAVQSWKNPLKQWGRYGKRNQYVYVCPHGHGEVLPYYCASASAIDWTVPTKRISDRDRPLQPATIARIQKGLEKFNGHLLNQTQPDLDVPPAADPLPFVMTERFDGVVRSLDEPLPTVLAAGVHHRLVQPFMVTLRRHHQPNALTDPLSTCVAGGTHHGLVQPFLSSYYSSGEPTPLHDPIPTVPTIDRHALVQPFLVNYFTPRISITGMNEPLCTVSTQPRTYLAEPTVPLTVEECGFRMLQPHEIQVAMAFADDYIVTGTKREKVRQLGNAVTPPVMKMLLDRCLVTL